MYLVTAQFLEYVFAALNPYHLKPYFLPAFFVTALLCKATLPTLFIEVHILLQRYLDNKAHIFSYFYLDIKDATPFM